MNRTERTLKNVLSNWAGFAVNALILLLLTPFVLSHLGIERYGVWILINSFIGYYGMLDFGFRAGVNQFLIRSLAARDFGQANTVFSSALAALTGFGAVILLLTFVATALVPELLDIPPASQIEAMKCILIVGTASAIQVLFSPFASIFVAQQRFDLLNLIAVAMKLLSASLTVMCLKFELGLPGLAAATATSTISGCVIRGLVAKKLLPTLSFSRQYIRLKTLAGIGSFGLWNFMIAMTQYAYLHFLPLLVAFFLPVAAVGHYALAAGLWHQINRLFTPIGQVIYPLAAELHVKQDDGALKDLYVHGTRLLLLIVLPVVLIAFTWSYDFYALWVGEEFLGGNGFTPVNTLLNVMLVSTVLGYTANFAGQILIGAGHVRSVAIVKFLGAIITVTVSAVFLSQFGLIAVSVGLIAGIFTADIVGTSIILRAKLGIHFAEFFFSSILPLSFVAIVIGSSAMVIKSLWIADSWLSLSGSGLLIGLIATGAVFLLGMSPEERRTLVIHPLNRLSRSRKVASTIP